MGNQTQPKNKKKHPASDESGFGEVSAEREMESADGDSVDDVDGANVASEKHDKEKKKEKEKKKKKEKMKEREGKEGGGGEIINGKSVTGRENKETAFLEDEIDAELESREGEKERKTKSDVKDSSSSLQGPFPIDLDTGKERKNKKGKSSGVFTSPLTDSSSKGPEATDRNKTSESKDSLGDEEGKCLGNANGKKRKSQSNSIDLELGENHARKKVKPPLSTQDNKTGKDGADGISPSSSASDEKMMRKKGNMVAADDGLQLSLEGTCSNGKDSGENNTTKKKSTMGSFDGSKTSQAKKPKKSRRVSFSNNVEVFRPTSDGSDEENAGKGLVQGKRFTLKEDKLIMEAVTSYIEAHQLGEEGLNMVLCCKKHPKLKNCWKEIGASLPWRPYEAVYYRAHTLYQRSEERKWEPEECEIIRRFHEKHGPDWKTLAEVLGKHRVHVKDTWRRIKLPNLKKGHWSQDEYQALFDLVNLDLRMKAFEEKKTKHGMLRDNISWEAISQKLSTRSVSTSCMKWYDQLTSPLVNQGLWIDSDDYRMLDSLQKLDSCCIEDVDWGNLVKHRSGDICRKRWNEMIRHIGGNKEKSFIEQVDVLSKRYCPEMLEYRK